MAVGQGHKVSRAETANYVVDKTLIIRDEKASGVAGGAASSTTWHTRVLNTEIVNNIENASLDSNQITLPQGVYDIDVFAPAFRVDEHKVALYNITDSTYDAYGLSSFSDNAASCSSTSALICYRFTITSEKVFEIRHYTTTAKTTNGFGKPTGISNVIEAYTTVKIVKVG